MPPMRRRLDRLYSESVQPSWQATIKTNLNALKSQRCAHLVGRTGHYVARRMRNTTSPYWFGSAANKSRHATRTKKNPVSATETGSDRMEESCMRVDACRPMPTTNLKNYLPLQRLLSATFYWINSTGTTTAFTGTGTALTATAIRIASTSLFSASFFFCGNHCYCLILPDTALQPGPSPSTTCCKSPAVSHASC